MKDRDLDRLLVKPGSRLSLDRRTTDDRFGMKNKSDGTDRARAAPRTAWPRSSTGCTPSGAGASSSSSRGWTPRARTARSATCSAASAPAHCRVRAFEVPTETELRHDYLWRVHAACPQRGEIGIFNRSHYEDVVTTVVLGTIGRSEARRRIEHIRGFERMLADEGTTVLKVFLHISPDEQRARLQARLQDPEKRWKFAPSDLEARARWPQYVAAYERALAARRQPTRRGTSCRRTANGSATSWSPACSCGRWRACARRRRPTRPGWTRSSFPEGRASPGAWPGDAFDPALPTRQAGAVSFLLSPRSRTGRACR